MGPPHSHDRNQPRRIAFALMTSHAFSRVLTNLSQMNISIIVRASSPLASTKNGHECNESTLSKSTRRETGAPMMRASKVRQRDREAGQSLVLVGVGMVVLIGVLGLAIDFGYYRYVRRELQTAADAAALAGAMDLSYLDVTTAAQSASSENGFTNGANGVTVTVYNPPHDGPYASSNYPTYVEAVVTQNNVPQFFSQILGVRPITLSASAVAAGGINCIYGLDTGSGALTVFLTIVQSACGVVDNDNLNLTVAALCAPSIQLKGSQTGFLGLACGPGFRNEAPVKDHHGCTRPAGKP